MPLTFAKDPETFERDYAALTTREAPPAAAARPAARSGDADGEIIDDFTTVGKGGKNHAIHIREHIQEPSSCTGSAW